MRPRYGARQLSDTTAADYSWAMTPRTAPDRHHALAKDLAGRVRGSVRFDPGERALYSTDASNYRHFPIGVVVPARHGRPGRDDRRLPRPRRPGHAPWRRHEPRRPGHERGRDRGCFAAPRPDPRARPGPTHRSSPARRDPGRPARRRRAVWPHLRSRSRHSRSLHAGRNARQRLVWRPLHHGRADERQRRVARGAHLRRPAADGRPDFGRRAGRPLHRDGPEGRDLPLPRLPPGPLRGPDPRALPQASAARFRLSARRAAAGERLRRGPRSDRDRGHLRHDPRGDGSARAQPARPRTAGARLRRRFRGGRPFAGDPGDRPDRARGLRRSARRGLPAQGPQPGGHRDPARGRWLAAGRVRGRRRPAKPRRRRGSRGRAVRRPGRCPRRSPTAAEQQALWTLRESAVGATAVVPGKPPTYPGWEDSAVPPERLGRYLRELRRAARTVRLRPHLLRPFRRRLPAPADDLRLPNPGRARATSARSWSRRPTWSSGTAARSRASTATARPAAELLPRMFGPELVAASASSSRSGTRAAG